MLGRDFDTGASFYIDRARLPENCPPLYAPDTWTEAQTAIVASHLRDHQARLDRGNTSAERSAFQWKTTLDVNGSIKNVFDDYMREIHPDSILEYGPDAALYLSRVLHEREQAKGRAVPFSSRSLELIRLQSSEDNGFAALADLLQDYCRLAKVEVRHPVVYSHRSADVASFRGIFLL